MKRFALLITALLLYGIATAHTVNWHVGNNIISTTTCESGDNIIPPTTPTKYGYHFKEWAAYSQVEYLESTGTQYIDTEVKQSDYAQNLIVHMDFQYTENIEDSAIIGVTDNTSNYFIPVFIRNGHFMSIAGEGASEINTQTADLNKHTMICNSVNGNISIDGINHIYTSNIANVDFNIYLLCRNDKGSTTKYSKARLYRAYFVTGNNTLIRDFIPVLDINGTPCMYEKVEGKFYYNQGTGQFIAGPVIQ